MSNINKVGMRVGVILSSEPEEKVVNLFGYGVYGGEQPLPPEFGPLEGLPNPCILLDSGEKVWGIECWWGPEARIKAYVTDAESKGYTIKTWTREEYNKEMAK